jgi:NAD(P)-dependent dehydrogenase (short-subunit alcohol dehydrogenase family)
MGMARVVIIGASKGIGLKTTRQALEAGHTVRAFARSAADISISDPKLEKVRGDALRSNEVAIGGQGDERRDPGVGRRSR